MHTSHMRKHDEDVGNTDARIDEHLKCIHQSHVPPFDLITCEILDSLLQYTTTEQIAHFSQLHVDTVRRMLHIIESTLDTSSHSQIIDNCQIRQWSTVIQPNKAHKTHTFE